jgi:hypothetical protein
MIFDLEKNIFQNYKGDIYIHVTNIEKDKKEEYIYSSAHKFNLAEIALSKRSLKDIQESITPYAR